MKASLEQVLRYLDERAPEFVTRGELALALSVSERTVSRIIDEGMRRPHDSWDITSRRGRGYCLDVSDRDAFDALVGRAQAAKEGGSATMPYDIILLLASRKCARVEDLAGHLLYSTQAVQGRTKDVRDTLAQYDLALDSRPNQGFAIVGDETSIQDCIVDVRDKADAQVVRECVCAPLAGSDELLRSLIRHHLQKEGTSIGLRGIDRFVFRVELAYSRKACGYEVRMPEEEVRLVKSEEEYAIVQAMCGAIEEETGLELGEDAWCYLAVHLMGRKVAFDSQTFFERDEVVNRILDRSFERIRYEYGIDLGQGEETRSYLANHMRPLISRIKYQIRLDNPLLSDIKKSHIKAYDMALVMQEVIAEETGCDVRDAEVGYIALYFVLAMEKSLQRRALNVLIISEQGNATALLYAAKIRDQYGSRIARIDTTAALGYEGYNLDAYDVILTTTPLELAAEKPVIRLSQRTLFRNDSVRELDDFLRTSESLDDRFSVSGLLRRDLFFHEPSMASRDEAIGWLCDRISRVMEVPDSFYHETMLRESRANTSFAMSVAIPHPMHYVTADTILSVLVLDEPLPWGEYTVKYVLFVSPSVERKREGELLNLAIATLLTDNKLLLRFMRDPTYETLLDILELLDTSI